ncbi:hypothetical protein [Leptolyngbya sp. FACHB-711]|uniref:hypothetical protein n=1 Tax=unclassified Leptolyngbya TaxID=2650499 RepID=UPI001683F1FB|nr:hypothetical protein [Leptolyngbya sp. FACHB-711]MBD1851558.1 hypothetical protein [Cyanobacteria bacterium FACHB-502]MBD2026708.1 hypothetical protein [Leptolyngbya sp. FACHB-711]
MRQSRFALYFSIGLFLVTLCTIVLLMVEVAPARSNAPFMGIMIDPGSSAPIVHLPNRLFNCTDENQQFRCQASLKEQPLQITFDQGKDYIYFLQNCRATYAGQATNCQAAQGGNMTQRGVLSYYSLTTNLGLTVPELKALQRQYWLTNLVGTSAEGFIWIGGWAIAAIGAALAIGLNWLEDNLLTRSFTSLSSGFGLALLTWFVLARIPYTTLAQYGINESTWRFVLPIITIAAGTLGSILTGFYVSRRTRPALKAVTSLLMGFATAFLSWFFFPIVLSVIPEGWWLRIPLTVMFGTATTILLLKDTGRSIKFFSCSVSALGAFVMLLTLITHLGLILGFAD